MTMEKTPSRTSVVWSVRLSFRERDVPVLTRIGPYFSLQSARNQASRAKGKGAEVLGIDTGIVTWEAAENQHSESRTSPPEASDG